MSLQGKTREMKNNGKGGIHLQCFEVAFRVAFRVITCTTGCMCMWLWLCRCAGVLLKGLSCGPRVVVVHMGGHSADTINARVSTCFSAVWLKGMSQNTSRPTSLDAGFTGYESAP